MNGQNFTWLRSLTVETVPKLASGVSSAETHLRHKMMRTGCMFCFRTIFCHRVGGELPHDKNSLEHRRPYTRSYVLI